MVETTPPMGYVIEDRQVEITGESALHKCSGSILVKSTPNLRTKSQLGHNQGRN